MSKCANCGAAITCGCQKRTLPNGKSGCSSCASKATKPTTKTEPVKTTQTVNRPWGADRYKHLQKFTKQ